MIQRLWIATLRSNREASLREETGFIFETHRIHVMNEGIVKGRTLDVNVEILSTLYT